jgi:hypothetical protein
MTGLSYFLKQQMCMLFSSHLPVVADRSGVGNEKKGKGLRH